MEFVNAVGQSGGLVCLWDPGVFKFSGSIKNYNFLIIKGRVKGCGEELNILNIYAPQGVSAKKDLWDVIESEIGRSSGMWILLGDFNSVRSPDERRNSAFKAPCARNFNAFIHNMGLVECNMTGKQFTCNRDYGKKLSKIDRMLVLQFLDCKDGFEEVVKGAAESLQNSGLADSTLSKKFSFIRNHIKKWRDDMLLKERETEVKALEEIKSLEETLVERELEEEEEWALWENKKVLKEFEQRKNKDLKQRARVRWAIDGDENSKFFHGSINYRKARNSILGLNIEEIGCLNRRLSKRRC
ncbi:uncharacterized protein LOC110866763 [Helianthus annuus]|uniref:uncharacterized protein LOC110866763 n=1 Tax=Helianthus annuus TaxID=4232 RepID=UPI000B8FB153|nr:uncharacterized protein LOC110866763 [Helianthus annuus]